MSEYRAYVGLDVHTRIRSQSRSHGRAGRRPSTGVSSRTGEARCRNSFAVCKGRTERP